MNAPWPPPNCSAFQRHLFRPRGHEAQHIARRFAKLLDSAADGCGFEITDSGRAAHVGKKNDAADFGEFVFHQRLDFGHRQGGGRKILGIAVVGDDVCSAGIDRAVACDEDENGVFFARRGFSEKSEKRCVARPWWLVRR